MTKQTYFVKISYTDPEQPLRRIHENYDAIEIDLYKGISDQVYNQVVNKWERRQDFTVDFMLLTGTSGECDHD